jgi:hypothetical protein
MRACACATASLLPRTHRIEPDVQRATPAPSTFDFGKDRSAMTPTRSAKPLVSAALALCFVLAFVVPFLQISALGLKNPNTPFDDAQAGFIRYAVIVGIALVWFFVQLFWRVNPESTKLGLAVSATIVWLAIAFFFGFRDTGHYDEGTRGAVAFFTLMGGLGIVLLWTRFLSDELTF